MILVLGVSGAFLAATGRAGHLYSSTLPANQLSYD